MLVAAVRSGALRHLVASRPALTRFPVVRVESFCKSAAPEKPLNDIDAESKEAPLGENGGPNVGETGGANVEDPPDMKTQILKAALTHVPTLGWSVEAVAAGATDHGLSMMAHGLFPRGPVELVEYFVESSNASLAEQLQAMTTADPETSGIPPSVPARLNLALKMRLEMVVPYRSNWSQALALLALPQNAHAGLMHAQTGTAEIWNFATYDSFEAHTNVMVKQAALGALYTSCELYLLTDSSPGHADTWAFLNRGVGDLHLAASLAKEVEDRAGFLAQPLMTFASMIKFPGQKSV